jgi:cytochrome c-type biogenesis protein CcmH
VILLAFALLLMTAMALAVVVGPLLRAPKRAPARAAFDRAVYRDQLKELERDRARGLIGEAESESARIEIERRMLAADRAASETLGASHAMPWVAALLVLIVAGGAGALYAMRGAPGVPDAPFAARTEPDRTADLKAAAAALEKRLNANPHDDEGWALLGETESQLGDWDKTAQAYGRAVMLAPANADYAAAYGEALVLGASGVVTPAAAAAFREALGHDPQNVVARYYMALADAQAGRTDAAIAAWQKMASDAPDGSPVRAAVKERIDEAAKAAGITPPPLAPPSAAAEAAAPPAMPGPNAGQMAAAAKMTPEERQQMIQGMVERLASELKQSPGNRDGWLQLARAYGVLGEPDKAADAFDHAASLDPKNVEIRLTEIDTLMAGRKPSDPMPPKAIEALKAAEAIAPGEPEVLWYLGLAAAQAKQREEAAQYWQRLLAALPAGSPERSMVSEALAAIKAH